MNRVWVLVPDLTSFPDSTTLPAQGQEWLKMSKLLFHHLCNRGKLSTLQDLCVCVKI